jgi:hypothetical protein
MLLYHLSHSSSLFYPGYSGDNVSLFAQNAWSGWWFSHFKFPTIVRMTGTYPYSQLFSIELGSCKLFCPGQPETRILQTSVIQVAWDDRHIPRWLAIIWHGVTWNFYQGWPWIAILHILASQLVRITHMRHWHLASMIKILIMWKIKGIKPSYGNTSIQWFGTVF